MELPVEIVTHIMGFLEDQPDLLSASLVAKTWNEASRDPCLQASDITITLSPSLELLTDVSHLDQTEASRLIVNFDVDSDVESCHGRRYTIRPSRKVSISCGCNNFTVKSPRGGGSSLFGITFDTLVLTNFPGKKVADICTGLLAKGNNILSLELSNASSLSPSYETKLIPALQNIRDIRLDCSFMYNRLPWVVKLTNLPLLKSLLITAIRLTKIEDAKYIKTLCDRAVGSLKISFHHVDMTTKLLEELGDYICDKRMDVHHLGIQELALTRDGLEWLGKMSHNVRILDLNLPEQPTLETLESIKSKLKSAHVRLCFPCEASDAGAIVRALSNVRSLAFKGDCFELRLGPPFHTLPGFHLTLENIGQEVLERKGGMLPSIINSPALANGVELEVDSYRGKRPCGIHKLVEGVKYLICDGTGNWTATYHKRGRPTDVDNILDRPMPKLRRLELQSTSLSDKGLRALANYASELRNLDVGGCKHISDEGIRTVVTNFKRLRRLNLGGCRSLTAKCVKYIAEHGSTIEELDVDRSDSYCDQAIGLCRLTSALLIVVGTNYYWSAQSRNSLNISAALP